MGKSSNSIQSSYSQIIQLLVVVVFLFNRPLVENTTQILWPRAELHLIRVCNLTQIYIEADVITTKKIFLPSFSTPTGTAALFLHCICQIKPDEGSSIFFFPSSTPSLLSCASLCSLVAGLIYNT